MKYPSQIRQTIEKINGSDQLSGYIFPKFDMSNARSYFDELKAVSGECGRMIYAMPIIESRAVSDLRSRVTTLLSLKEVTDPYRDHIVNIRIGGNDFCSRFGVRRGIRHYSSKCHYR